MQINDQLRSIIARTTVDDRWLGRSQPLLHKLSSEMASQCSSVLDIGKSSRDCCASTGRLLHLLKSYRNKQGAEYISNALDKLTRRAGLQTTGYVVHANNRLPAASSASPGLPA